jgi:hypothetical protein
LRPSCSISHDRFPVVLKIPFFHAMELLFLGANGPRFISEVFYFDL